MLLLVVLGEPCGDGGRELNLGLQQTNHVLKSINLTPILNTILENKADSPTGTLTDSSEFVHSHRQDVNLFQ